MFVRMRRILRQAQEISSPEYTFFFYRKKFINQPFPGEHPYTSHMEKFAFIPKFDSPQDPKRGVAARQVQPINDEMPANAYNVTVVKKIKGGA